MRRRMVIPPRCYVAAVDNAKAEVASIFQIRSIVSEVLSDGDYAMDTVSLDSSEFGLTRDIL